MSTPDAAGAALRLGAVTIGQSPRVDVTSDLAPLLPNVELLERGALDDLTDTELAALARRPAGAILATRLRDGRQIVVGEDDVAPRVQAALDDLVREGAAATLLLCTGDFPPLRCSVPLLLPDRILQGVVRAVFPGGTLGVITPHEAQRASQAERWTRAVEARVRVEVTTPYQPDPQPGLRVAARRLREAGVAMVVMDCLGYGTAMRAAVRAELDTPVLLARTVLGRVAAEMIGL